MNDNFSGIINKASKFRDFTSFTLFCCIKYNFWIKSDFKVEPPQTNITNISQIFQENLIQKNMLDKE